MDKKTLHSFLCAALLILIAAVIFAGVESEGRMLESGFAIMAIVVIVTLVVSAVILSPPKEDDGSSKSPKIDPIAPPVSARRK